MTAVNKPKLSVDFDGVVSKYENGWQGAAVINDSPTPGMAQFMASAVRYFTVCIFSSRSNQPGGQSAMRQALLRWLTDALGEDSASHVYAQLEWPSEKPSAFVSIDDRAIQFNGVWPDPRELLHFKPWNRRSPPDASLGQDEAAIVLAYRKAEELVTKGKIVRDIFMSARGEAVMKALSEAWPSIDFGDN
jgi:hypothetical protein